MAKWNSIVLETLNEAFDYEAFKKALTSKEPENKTTNFDLRTASELKKEKKDLDQKIQKQLEDTGLNPDHEPNESSEEFLKRLEITVPNALNKKAEKFNTWLTNVETNPNNLQKKDLRASYYDNFKDLEYDCQNWEYLMDQIKQRILFFKLWDLPEDAFEYNDEYDFNFDNPNDPIDNRSTDATRYIDDIINLEEFQKSFQDFIKYRQDPVKLKFYLKANGVEPTKLQYNDYDYKKRFAKLGIR